MKISFRVTRLDGTQVPSMSAFSESLVRLLIDATDAEDVTIEDFGFTLYRIPTITEIIDIEQSLIKLGLTLDNSVVFF